MIGRGNPKLLFDHFQCDLQSNSRQDIAIISSANCDYKASVTSSYHLSQCDKFAKFEAFFDFNAKTELKIARGPCLGCTKSTKLVCDKTTIASCIYNPSPSVIAGKDDGQNIAKNTKLFHKKFCTPRSNTNKS